MKIGEVDTDAEVSVDTVRFYERHLTETAHGRPGARPAS